MNSRIGKQYGNYRLTQMLGQGGFAEVYLGEHIFLKTSAAIKILHQEHMQPTEQEAFLQEARVIAKLTHPHIVRLLDFGLQDTIPFLVMDYAPGGTLRGVHARGTRLLLETACTYAHQVAEALQFAHNQHLIHRDIKPENMLIGPQKEILVGDFGIALAVQSSRAVSTQEVIGTTQYMAPEQILGKPHLASDQYALAIVVYEWLCGTVPFRGSFTEVCAQHIHAPLPPLDTQRLGLPPDVMQVLTRALAKTPEGRFATIREFVTALEAIGTQTARANPPPAIAPTLPARPPLASPIMAAPSAPPPITAPPVVTNAPYQQQMMVSSDASETATEEYAYHTLRKQIEESNATSLSEGALVVRAPASLAGQVIYLQPTVWWKQQPGQQYMRSAEVRRQVVLGHSLTSALFRNLQVQGYTFWTPQHEPVQVNIVPQQATLLEIGKAKRIPTTSRTSSNVVKPAAYSSNTNYSSKGVLSFIIVILTVLIAGWLIFNTGNDPTGIIVGIILVLVGTGLVKSMRSSGPPR